MEGLTTSQAKDGVLENLLIGIFFVCLPLRYIYYRANRSKLQWENLDDKLNSISELLARLKKGEDLTHRSFRSLGGTVVEVLRDGNWIKLPSVILLEGDIVRVRPGQWLPSEAEGLSRHYEGRTVAPFETIEDYPSDNVLRAKRKVKFVLKSTPANDLCNMILTERAQKKKKSSTFFMICLKTGTLLIRVYILCLLAINTGFGILWVLMSERKWYLLMVNPAYLFLAVIPVLLPSLVKALTCWGNAVLWCICEQFASPTDSPACSNEDKVSSLLKSSFSKEDKNVDGMNNIANQAEQDFDDRDMASLVRPVNLRACVSKFRSFLIGGIQRDFNILDMLSSTSFMCFIDREGIISENAKYIDELVVMGHEENKIVALDLEHKSPLDIIRGQYEHDQIDFSENKWVEHFNALKTLGLASSLTRNPRPGDLCRTLVNLNEDHWHTERTGELFNLSKREEIEIFEDCMCVLARRIGLSEDYIMKHEHVCTLWSTMTPQSPESHYSVPYTLVKPLKKKVKYVPQVNTVDETFFNRQKNVELEHQMTMAYNLLSSIILSESNGYQMFSQGSPRVILFNCTDYFDGNDIVMLENEDRQRLNTVLQQWTADNYQTIGFSYKPIMDESIRSIVSNPELLADLDEETRAILHELQSKQIFLGMIAVANHCKSEANHFREDLSQAGIRFVIFNEGTYLETKAFGNDLGLDTAWNSCIILDESSPQNNAAGAVVLPRSIAEIKEFLYNQKDLVPMFISMFANARKQDMLEMIKIYQEFGEIVMVVGGCLHIQNLKIYQAADISIGISTQPCGFCTTCNGLRLFYGRSPGFLEQISERFISLPCIFTIGPQYPLYIILSVIKEARRLMSNIKSGLLFAALMYVSWSFCGFIAICVGLPPVLSPVQCVYITLIVVPSLALSFLSSPSPEKMMKFKPIKPSLFVMRKYYGFFRNICLRILLFTVLILCLHVWHLSHSFDEYFFYQWAGKDGLEKALVEQNLVIFFLGTWLTCVFSASGVNGFESWLKQKAINNKTWLVVGLVNQFAAFLIVLVYLGVYDLFSAFGTTLGKGWVTYGVFLLCSVLSVGVLELLNWEVRRMISQLQMTLKHFFDTKLGTYSPR